MFSVLVLLCLSGAFGAPSVPSVAHFLYEDSTLRVTNLTTGLVVKVVSSDGSANPNYAIRLTPCLTFVVDFVNDGLAPGVAHFVTIDVCNSSVVGRVPIMVNGPDYQSLKGVWAGAATWNETLYVPFLNYSANSLDMRAFNMTTGKLIAKIPYLFDYNDELMPNSPTITVDPDTATAYTGESEEGILFVHDLITRKQLRALSVPFGLNLVVYDTVGKQLIDIGMTALYRVNTFTGDQQIFMHWPPTMEMSGPAVFNSVAGFPMALGINNTSPKWWPVRFNLADRSVGYPALPMMPSAAGAANL